MTCTWIGLLIVGLIPFIGIGGWMRHIGEELKTDLSPNGIIALELARSPTEARLILTDWKPKGVAAAVHQITLDYYWVVSYVIVLMAMAALAADLSHRLALGSLARLGEWLMFGSVFAGLLDWAENNLMLWTIHRYSRDPRLEEPLVAGIGITAATRYAATAKFLLVGAVLIYGLILTPAAALLRWLLCDCPLPLAQA